MMLGDSQFLIYAIIRPRSIYELSLKFSTFIKKYGHWPNE